MHLIQVCVLLLLTCLFVCRFILNVKFMFSSYFNELNSVFIELYSIVGGHQCHLLLNI